MMMAVMPEGYLLDVEGEESLLQLLLLEMCGEYVLSFFLTKLNCADASYIYRLLDLSLSSTLWGRGRQLLVMGLSKPSLKPLSECSVSECFLVGKYLRAFLSFLVLISNNFSFIRNTLSVFREEFQQKTAGR